MAIRRQWGWALVAVRGCLLMVVVDPCGQSSEVMVGHLRRSSMVVLGARGRSWAVVAVPQSWWWVLVVNRRWSWWALVVFGRGQLEVELEVEMTHHHEQIGSTLCYRLRPPKVSPHPG